MNTKHQLVAAISALFFLSISIGTPEGGQAIPETRSFPCGETKLPSENATIYRLHCYGEVNATKYFSEKDIKTLYPTLYGEPPKDPSEIPDSDETFRNLYAALGTEEKKNLQEELEAYCDSDVDILQRACGVFRKLFCEYSGLEPLRNSLTISLACNRVYRTNFLGRKEVPLIPACGIWCRNQSSLAFCWLTHEYERLGVPMRHHKMEGDGG